MKNENSIPEESRFLGLKEFLYKFVQETIEIVKKDEYLSNNSPNPFLSLCDPWLLMPVEEFNESYIKQQEIWLAKGFDGKQIKEDLEIILENDKQLKDCCGITLVLASFLGEYFINHLVFASLEDSEFLNKSFDEAFKKFSDFVFSQPVKRYVLSHLFNFDAEEEEIAFTKLRVRKLNRHTISQVVGGYPFSTYIHTIRSGEYFVVIETENESSDFVDWVLEEVNKSELLAWFLQYFKDGLIYVDYSIVYYAPEWINNVRRNYFPFILGDPHRFLYSNGKNPYYLSKADADFLKQWVKIYEHPLINKRAEDQTADIRKAILRAGEFYQSSHKQKGEPERLIHLAVALEALFSPTDNSELSFRIKQYASLFIGQNVVERKEIFDFLGKIYKIRSKVVHGSFDIDKFYEGNLILEEDNQRLASIIRKSLLGFFILYLKGENKRENILKRLEESALDSDIANQIRKDRDIELFVKETLEKYFPVEKNQDQIETDEKVTLEDKDFYQNKLN